MIYTICVVFCNSKLFKNYDKKIPFGTEVNVWTLMELNNYKQKTANSVTGQ